MLADTKVRKLPNYTPTQKNYIIQLTEKIQLGVECGMLIKLWLALKKIMKCISSKITSTRLITILCEVTSM
jgi:hypothetical protein